MRIRGIANVIAVATMIVGLVARIATGRPIWDLLFIGGFLFLFVAYFSGWLVRGNEIGYPRADDLRRADDENEPKGSILPPNWPGPP